MSSTDIPRISPVLTDRRDVLFAVAEGEQIHDLLECVWPAALDTAKQPYRSRI